MRDGGDCPICKGEVERIDRKRVPAEGGKTRRVSVFLCMECNFQGTAREFDQRAHQEIIDDRIAFYYCKEYHLGLYYREKTAQTDPIGEERVDIPRLNNKVVKIEFVGLGEEGQMALANLIGPEAPVYPVDLWHEPGCIDPHVSHTVTEELYAKWEEFVHAAERH